jgi:mRNA interferase ChpB
VNSKAADRSSSSPPDNFNRATGAPVVLPITTGGAFARRLGYAVEITGIQTTGIVRCDQPRTVDLEGRQARKVGALPAEVLDEVLARVASIFD